MIEVRVAGLRDMRTLCRLEAHCFGVSRLFAGQWQRAGRPESKAWMAQVDDAAAGFLIAYPHRFNDVERSYIAALGVVKVHRRHGVGRALLSHAMAAFGAVWLHVRASNAPAIALYEAMGFTVVQHVGAYYRDGEGAYVMGTW